MLTRPAKELPGFKRITLAAGEARRVQFTWYRDQLAFYGRDMKLAVEPGGFRVMVGSSSSDIRLEGAFAAAGEKTEVNGLRHYFSREEVLASRQHAGE